MENLHLKAEGITGNLITFLEGKALTPKEPNQISITGDIKTVSTFLGIRNKDGGGTGQQAIDKSKAVITVDKKALSIVLHLDPENYYGTTITGVLQVSDELKNFHINQKKLFSKKELIELIKFNRIYFSDADKYAAILLAFQKTSSTVNIKANDSADDRGNKERAFIKEVETNAPTEFTLNIPIFKGFDPSVFKVTICLDVNESALTFWFESVQLHEMMQALIDEIFSAQLGAATDFVIVNK